MSRTFRAFELRGPARQALSVAVLGLMVTVCGGEPTASRAPADLEPVSNVTISGTAGAAVVSPSVKVTDGGGAGFAGITVTFAVSSGGGTITGGTQATGADGVATVGTWTLGTVAGANTLTATVAGLAPVTFSASGAAGPPAKLSLTTSPPASVQNRVVWTTQPVVQLRDQHGNAVSQAGVAVSANATVGATLGVATVATDASGKATFTNLAIGTTTGSRVIDFTAPGLEKTTANITVSAGAPSALALLTPAIGVSQNRVKLSPQPVVQLQDVDGNAVLQAGVPVTAVVAAGGGALTGASVATTGVTGTALFDFSIDGLVGAKTIEFTATSLASASLAVTVTVGAPAALVVIAGNAQTATVATALSTAPSVRVDDADANVVPGVPVTFAVSAGGGTVTGAAGITNALGVATLGSWTLGTVAGANGMSAMVAAIAPATFTATGTAGAAVGIAAFAGAAQTAVVATALPVSPAVKASDLYGNGVSGVPVTFAVIGGAGQLVGGSTVTNASGVASPTTWTLGIVAGNNSLSATSTGLGGSPVTFSATGAPGPATQLAVAQAPTDSVPSRALFPVQPSVRLLDAHGNAVPQAGTTITASLTSGGGELHGTASLATQANGSATFTNLALRGLEGTKTVTYSSAGVVNTTSTHHLLAGPASIVVAVQGNGQSQPFWEPLPTAPVVRLLDADSNQVAGDTVVFAVTGGAGSIEFARAVSEANGTAYAGAWKLGPLVGTNTLTATVLTPASRSIRFTGGPGSLGPSGQEIAGNPVTFTATATEPVSCANPAPLEIGTTVNRYLGDSSCRHSALLPYFHPYSITTTAAQTTFYVAMNAVFNAEVRNYMWPAAPTLYSYGNGSQNITFYYVLAPGTYRYEVAEMRRGWKGTYSLTTAEASVLPYGCPWVSISKGVTMAHSLDLGCNRTKADSTTGATKEYLIWVPAGESLSMTMNSSDFDPLLEVYRGAATWIFNTSDDNSGGGTSASVTIAPLTFARQYLIRATNAGAGPLTGNFTLTVNP